MKPDNFFKIFVMMTLVSSLLGTTVPISAQSLSNDILYTTDADFDKGTLVSVNHNAPNNHQLQLDAQIKPFPFINVAASGRGTLVRTNTETGVIVGEYRTAPEGRSLNPSRTTVDLFGNVWTANRDEVGEIDGVSHGSTVKIGLIVGGTRVNESGSPNPNGSYLAPPFDYNTCADRDGDGRIRTSKGLGDILDWPDITDGLGGTDGIVEDAVDECILIYQRLYDAEQARHVSVDADNNVWVGGYPFVQRMFYKLDGATGAVLDSFDTRDIGCGGYGGLVDGNGILWSVGGALLRYDPVTRIGTCIQQYGYGLGIDTNGYIWMSLWDGGIVKIAPDGTVVSGFPKMILPSSTTMTSLTTVEMDGSIAELPNPGSKTHAYDVSILPKSAGEAPLMKEPVSHDFSRDRISTAYQQNGSQVLSSPLAGDPSVTFQVAPVNNWVSSFSSWTPGTTILLTIEEGGSVVYTDSQTADVDGNFFFRLWEAGFTLKRGQVVTVSDGTTTKAHTVMPFYLDGVNITDDTLFGRAAIGVDVEVWVHQGGWVTVPPDASGNWSVDFTDQIDLNYMNDGGSRQTDDDGDATGVWWASPRIQVAPEDDWVQSSGNWIVGTTATLTITDGGGVAYSASQTVDPDGHFNFNLWNVFDLHRGQVVTVSNGSDTKIHTVMPLYVDGVDVDAETIFGRADASANVDVWVHGDGGLNVTPDGSGNWSMDFSGRTDLTYLSDGGSQQVDPDGDATGVWWVASRRFQVSPDDEWVQSSNRWTPGATITLTIAEGGSVVYTDSQTADLYGNFNFNLWDVFDLQRGQVVTVSDGSYAKTHTVMPLYVDDTDMDAETISGRADPAGSEVDIWVYGDGNLNVTPDSSGNWTADFSGQTDLTYFSDGGAQQFDDDGDSTSMWWGASRRFQVSPDDEWVSSWNRWAPGATVTLTIEDGGVVVYSDSQVSDVHGNFNFNFGGSFDLQRGQVVTVSDGTTTKTHTVMPLFADGFDVAADTVFGRAVAGTNVDVWVHGNGGLTVTTDGSGNWTADFSGQTDLTSANDGGSAQYDDDGDSTGDWWSAPRFWAAPVDDWVGSMQPWRAGVTITLTIAEGGAVVYTDSQVTDTNGNFNFNMGGIFDLKPGNVVTVSDGTTTKTHKVMPLYVDRVDLITDTVFGRADAGTAIDVWVHGDGNLNVTADTSGNWTANFSGMTDITQPNDGGSGQYDDDGDGTGVWWAYPSFRVNPDNDWVESRRAWTPNATITLTVENGGSVVYSDTQTADIHGNFGFYFSGTFDLQRGQVVTVNDGTYTKTHTVQNLYVDSINVIANTVSGRADAGSSIVVWTDDNDMQIITADGSGHWTADFSGITDITYLTNGSARQVDDDNDITRIDWSSPNFHVSPDDNWVQQWNRWTPGTTITLTIEDGSGGVYSYSQIADAHGNFNFNNLWPLDLDTGYVVTVSDGTTTKTHTVTDATVTDIDTETDQIHGSANPGARLWVWVYLFNDGSGRWVTADPDGNWIADFSVEMDGQPAYNITDVTRIEVDEFDDDGDATWRRFGPPSLGSTGVTVTPIDNNVWIANRNPGTVTRLDNDGNFIAIIPTGNIPTGVAVDAAGKLWATNLGSDNMVRINPNDGLGAIDLTVDLGPEASPYNYSDMTGMVVVGSTSPQGFWTVVQDSQSTGFEWGRIIWNTEPQGSEPPGTAITVEARSANTEAGLGGQTFQQVMNRELFSMFGRFIEVRVTLKASPEGTSPVLSDIRIQPHVVYVDIDIKPGSYPNSINCKPKNEVISVAVLTTEYFDALSLDYRTVKFEGAKEIHVDKRTSLPVQHTEDVDLDGDLDLVFHFYLRNTTLTCASTTGQLKGLTYGEVPIEGTDSVRMVGR